MRLKSFRSLLVSTSVALFSLAARADISYIEGNSIPDPTQANAVTFGLTLLGPKPQTGTFRVNGSLASDVKLYTSAGMIVSTFPANTDHSETLAAGDYSVIATGSISGNPVLPRYTPDAASQAFTAGASVRGYVQPLIPVQMKFTVVDGASVTLDARGVGITKLGVMRITLGVGVSGGGYLTIRDENSGSPALSNIRLASGNYLVTAKPVNTVVSGSALLQATFNSGSVWAMHVTAFDGIATQNDVTTPLLQAIDFVQQHSRFKVSATVVDSNLPHTYTYWSETQVTVDKNDLDQGLIASWPSRDGYMYFWKLFGRVPLQGGSTWGVDGYGILNHGIVRAYSHMPTDIWWWNDDPFPGFPTRKAQIITHELVNQINATLSQPPYNCTPVNSNESDAAAYEADRLSQFTLSCYESFFNNHH